MFLINFINIEADPCKIKTPIFKVFQSDLIVDEFIEKFIQGILDKAFYRVEARQLFDNAIKDATEHFLVFSFTLPS